MPAQPDIRRSPTSTSPGREYVPEPPQQADLSPSPLPAYRENPRFTTAPHAKEMTAPRRAIGNPRPDPWLYTCG